MVVKGPRSCIPCIHDCHRTCKIRNNLLDRCLGQSREDHRLVVHLGKPSSAAGAYHLDAGFQEEILGLADVAWVLAKDLDSGAPWVRARADDIRDRQCHGMVDQGSVNNTGFEPPLVGRQLVVLEPPPILRSDIQVSQPETYNPGHPLRRPICSEEQLP